MSHRLFARAVACAAFACALSAQAAPPADLHADLRGLVRLPPARLAAVLRSLGGSRAAAAPGSKIDTVPPVLKAFTMTAPADVSAPFAQVRVEAWATDDLSGVLTFWAVLEGPSGQILTVSPPDWWLPTRNFHQLIAADTSAYMEPGTWTVLYVDVFDTENNRAEYDTAAIAGLGNATIEIANSHSRLVDLEGPELLFGKIRTPVVSATGHPKGTDTFPIIGADFTITDSGSGVDDSNATWCLADMSSCIGAVGEDSVRGEKHAVIGATGTQYSPPPIGVYELYTWQAHDHAGNGTVHVSKDFGGDTDFSTYFPGGTSITITP